MPGVAVSLKKTKLSWIERLATHQEVAGSSPARPALRALRGKLCPAVLVFFFQAEDGIRDYVRYWSSDVCSSDLMIRPHRELARQGGASWRSPRYPEAHRRHHGIRAALVRLRRGADASSQAPARAAHGRD